MLKTETNTHEVAEEINTAFLIWNNVHEVFSVDFEHGQHWVTCLRCGAQWSVVDTEVGDFDFEEVTRGDETCDEG